MRLSSDHSRSTRSRRLGLTSWALVFSQVGSLSRAFSITPVPVPNLNLQNLGSIGIAGDFQGISLYQYEGQTEKPFSSNGSEALLVQLPNGLFSDLLDTDASIQAMCVFRGSLIIGGNFTSLGGQNSPGVAAVDLNTTKVTPLAGLTGQVNSLMCDDAAGMVYVGGSFDAGGPTNAITWVATNNWASLPFSGFNGPITSITKAANGHIIFGGSFTGLGNASAPSQPDGQVINLSSASIEGSQGTSTAGFSDPKNIVCKTDGVDAAGSTWLLADNTPGSWKATMKFGFEPSKLRLWNTRQDGRGTKTWRYTALPDTGIMNFTYIDPATGRNASCTSECPLSNDPAVKFQDFHFVNRVGMNSFRLDVSAWYGRGGGLNGVELFGNDTFAYAINDFNEPSCAGLSFPSTATATGPWSVTTSGLSNSEYLSARLTDPIQQNAASVVFRPDIRDSGEYVLRMFTPGCKQDNTCSTRGQVNVTWTLTSGAQPQSTVIYQTNDFDKYDQLAIAQMDAASGSFRPSVTLTPQPDQGLSEMTVVALRVGFSQINSTGGLNGLFEFDPAKATVSKADFSESTFNKLGSSFSRQSGVTAMVTEGDVTFISGNFSSTASKNIVGVNSKDNTTLTLSGGLNGDVLTLYSSNGSIFAGGSFTNTVDGSGSNLNNIAIYDTTTKAWSPLGAGVDGSVSRIVPLKMNITGNAPEDVVSLSGRFSKIMGFGGKADIPAAGFAVWVKSRNNWLQNLDGPIPSLSGHLSTSLFNLPDGSSLYAGSLSSQGLSARGAATLGEKLGSFPVNFLPTSSSISKSTKSKNKLRQRAALANTTSTISGVVAGAFYNPDNTNRNITIFAGHFNASSTGGSTVSNVVLVDGANNNNVSGLPAGISPSSVFLTVSLQNDTLFAGGQVNGSIANTPVGGIVAYNLVDRKYPTQPPAISGRKAVVASITVRPNTGDVYVGGSFTSAGSLGCPGVCLYSTTTLQWSRPGLDFEGDVNTMLWQGDSKLIVGGQLLVKGSSTNLASYDPSQTAWTSFNGASSLPGPVEAMTFGSSDGNTIWVTGSEPNGNVYLMKYDGSSWQRAGVTLDPSTVVNSLQMFTVTTSHDSSPLVDSNRVLLLTGSIGIPGFGTASAALFNGTTVRPYILSSNSGNTAGSISKVFIQKPENIFQSSGGGGLALGFIVLIALAIALGLMLFIVVAGLVLDRYRKKREGYVPAPTSMYDRGSGIQRIPPNELFDNLNKGRSAAPQLR